MLEQLGEEFGFVVYPLEAKSPAGQRLAQVSGLRRLPGIYVDLKLVAWGRPRPEALRHLISEYFRR